MKGKRTWSLIGLLMLGCMLPAFTVPLGAVYDRDSRLYRSLENLALETHVLMPISTTPVTGHQLYSFFQNIPADNIPSSAKALYDEVSALFSDDSGYTRLSSSLISGGMSVTPEIYLHTNPATDLTEMDWTYRYKDRSPILSFRGEAIIADTFHGVFDFDFKKTRGYADGTGNDGTGVQEKFFTGLLTHNIAFTSQEQDWDSHAPFSAFMSYSRPHFSIIFGRDTVAWGRGNTGDMIIGGEADFHDFLQYTVYDKALAYTFNAMVFDDITGSISDPLSFYDEGMRVFTAKRIEASITPRIRVALSSIALYYASALDLRMFNPLMWEHNFINKSNDYTDPNGSGGIPGGSYNEVNNAMALDVEVAVAPGWGAYGQFFVDQIQLGGEASGVFDPNAFGFLAGTQFSRPYKEGRLTGFAELAYTTPGLYLKEDPGTKPTQPPSANPAAYYAWHRYKMLSNLPLVRANDSRDAAGVGFIGYHYGPDTFVTAASVAYDVQDAYALQVDMEFSIHGDYGLKAHGRKENHLSTVTSSTEMVWLHGTLEYRLAAGVSGTKTFSNWLEGFARLDGVAVWNQRNQTGNFFGDMQMSLGATVSISRW